MEVRTVCGVSTWQSTDGDGSFILGIPTEAQVKHDRLACERAYERMHTEDEEELAYSEDFSWSPVDTEDGYEEPVWWFENDSCDAGVDCVCGRASLLAVLSNIDPDERHSALKAHVDSMRELFDHFWSGQGLLDGQSSSIGSACATCLTAGHVHVWGVYASACEMAEELGEAMSAYEHKLWLGADRYPTR